VLSDLKVRVITSGNQPTADRMVAVKLPALIEVKEKDDGKDGSPLTALTKQGQQFTTSFQKNTKKLSPVTFVDGQTKGFPKKEAS